MSEKRVIAVIVEGPSDEIAIGGILKEFFSSEEVQFAVVHGDITSESSVTIENAVSEVNKLVQGIVTRYGYKMDDFIRIIHIVDTDGAFTKDCIVKGDDSSTLYYEDHIETNRVEAIESRNKHKAEILFKLYTTGKINNIRYNVYYNSCNLEHVLHGKLMNYTDDEKARLSDDFAERYEGKVEEFIKYISDDSFAVPGTYKETWKYIQKDKNSLKRNTNMRLIFEKK